VVLIAFPFTGGQQAKNRPALVILDEGDADLLVARITSRPGHSASDVTLSEWKAAGLLVPSVARIGKMATLEKTMVRRKLGSLQAADRKLVAAAARAILAEWS
jgi:mRNA interferase MazF